MRVLAIGIRGIPGIQGGVETHAEELYKRLAEKDCEISVVVRPSWFESRPPKIWNRIRIVPLWSPKVSGIEPVLHTFLGVIYGIFQRPDVVHIHAVGPAIMTGFARLFGLKLLFTHHGADYDREKWGRFARFFLRLGEKSGIRFAHEVIAVSPVVKADMEKRFGRSCTFIPNGVNRVTPAETQDALKQFGLTARQYVLQVSRVVPEKRQLSLLDAFLELPADENSLVFVGGLDNSRYSRELQARARGDDRIVLTDFQSGLALRELLSHAGVFVLPSSHEGLPIALLEAMSYDLPVLASDISANMALELDRSCYFKLTDPNSLKSGLRNAIASARQTPRRKYDDLSRYDWDHIADQTYKLLRKVACK